METRYSRLCCSYDSCKRSRFLRAEMRWRASRQHWMFSPGCHKIISTHVSLVEANSVVHLPIPSEGSEMQPSCVPKKSLCARILPQSSLYLFICLPIHYFFPFHMMPFHSAVSSNVKKFLSLMRSYLSIFYFVDCTFGVISKKSSLNLIPLSCPLFSSSSFIVLGIWVFTSS